MLRNGNLTPSDIFQIAKRRLVWIVLPTIVMPLVALGIASRLEPKFVSEALVLIDQQRVPDKFVTPVVQDQLTVRLATMEEQIKSRTSLQPVIERFGLYSGEVGKVPAEDLVDELRKAIELRPIRSEGSTGLPGFKIYVTYRDPMLARQVCNEVLSKLMQENLKIRAQHAEGTTSFLTAQLDEAKRGLDEQDQRLAEFKRKYFGKLPEDEQRNLQMLTTLSSQLEAVNQSLGQARQQKMVQEAFVAEAKTTRRASGANAVSASQLDDMRSDLDKAQANLSMLQSRYTEDHPDVRKQKSAIATLKAKIDAAEQAAAKTEKAAAQKPDVASEEPLQSRLAMNLLNDTIRTKSREQEALQNQISRYQSAIQLSPTVEEQYKQLTRDYDTALRFYNDLLAKKTQSEMATDLERQQQGEQFRVMDPPSIPGKPVFPDKQLFGMGGLGFGLAIGIGLAILLELMQNFLRTDRDVEECLQLPTLAIIPTINDETTVWRRFIPWRRRTKQFARGAV